MVKKMDKLKRKSRNRKSFEDELSNLFKPGKKRRTSETTDTEDSEEEELQHFEAAKVILLNRLDHHPPDDLQFFYRNHLIKEYPPLPKNCSKKILEAKIRQLFPDHLKSKDEFEILKKEGNYLVAPACPDIGKKAHQIFRVKTMYIRPLGEHLNDNQHTEAGCSSSKANDDGETTSANLRTNDSSDMNGEFGMNPSEWDHLSMSGDTFAVDSSNTNEITDLTSGREVLAKKVQGAQRPVNVYRGRVLKSAGMRLLSDHFDETKSLFITFYNENSEREEGIDCKGLTTEFLRLVFEEMRISEMFEGPPTSKDLALDNDSLRNKEYHLCGKIIALALSIPNAPLPNFFSSRLFDQIVKGNNERIADISLIHDDGVKEEIQQIILAEDLTQLQNLVRKSIRIPLLGGPANVTSFSQKKSIVTDFMDHFINKRLKEPFAQLLSGLETLGALELIQKYPEVFRSAFLAKETPLTAEDLKTLFSIKHSDDPSEKAKETAVLIQFHNYLEDVEDGSRQDINLSMILEFCTSHNRIPAGGFVETPTVAFRHEKEDTWTEQMIHAEAATCFSELTLPVLSSCNPDVFFGILDRSFRVKGFQMA